MTTLTFPYRPIRPIIERWQWVTEVLQSEDGTEDRRQIREHPRQTWEMTVPVPHPEYNALLRSQHYQQFYIPIWQQGEITTSQITAGASSVSVDTDVSDWRTSLIIWASSDSYEHRGIASVGSGVINLSSNVVSTYAAGATVAPMRTARLANMLRIREDAQNVLLDLTWIILDSTTFTGYDWAIQFQEEDVITDRYLIGGDLIERSLEAAVDEIDYGTGELGFSVKYEPDIWGMPNLYYEISESSERWKWLTWFHKAKGRYAGLWLPTWKNDFAVVESFAATDRWIIIENINYSVKLLNLTSNKAIFFQRHGSLSPLARYIINAEYIDADTEKIRLDSNLGFAGNPSSFKMCSWMHPVRLNTDAVELTYDAADKMTISVPVRERVVSLEYTPPDKSEFIIALMVESKTLDNYANDYETLLEAEDWVVDVYLDSEMPAVGDHDFDLIIVLGFWANQATNAALLLDYSEAGIPIIIGNQQGMTNNATGILALIGFCTAQSGNTTLNVGNESMWIQPIKYLNGTDEEGELNPNLGLPDYIRHKDSAVSSKTFFTMLQKNEYAAEHVRTHVPKTTDDGYLEGDTNEIYIATIYANQHPYIYPSATMVFAGNWDTANVTDVDIGLCESQMMYCLDDTWPFMNGATAGRNEGNSFEIGSAGSIYYDNLGTGSWTHKSATYPPGSFTGDIMELIGNDEVVINLSNGGSSPHIHCNWTRRNSSNSKYVGFAMNFNNTTYQKYGGGYVKTGYIYVRSATGGSFFVYYHAPDLSNPGYYIQSSYTFASFGGGWGFADQQLNTEIYINNNAYGIQSWGEGYAVPEELTPGGYDLTAAPEVYTSGICGPCILAGSAAQMDINFWNGSV